MKHFIIGIALALALVLGIAAFAETAEPATEPVPALTEEAPVEDTATEAPAAEAETADDSAALQEALEAYRAAKESEHLDDLTEELNGYVAAGKLTQEQADLILNSMKERMAARNGECPNCGYQFQNNGGRMGGQKGQRGGNNQHGSRMGRMNGQMPGNQAQPNGQMPGSQAQPNGQMPGSQAQPNGPQQAPQM